MMVGRRKTLQNNVILISDIQSQSMDKTRLEMIFEQATSNSFNLFKQEVYATSMPCKEQGHSGTWTRKLDELRWFYHWLR